VSLRLRGMFFALMVYAMLIGINFTAKGQAMAERLNGAQWLGIPSHVAFALITGLVTSPLLAVPYHLLKIMERRLEDRGTVTGQLGFMLYLLRVGRLHSDLRSSQAIVVWGGLYFFVLIGAWIAFTASRGV
jgi:hypothetical protein